MVTTTMYAMRYKLQKELDQLVGEIDSIAAQPLIQAMNSFLSAMKYDDDTLMRSHLNDALEVFLTLTDCG